MRRLALVLLLAGCVPDAPVSYGISFGSHFASPVVVTHLAVNEQSFQIVPQVVDGWSDRVMPRSSGLYSTRFTPVGDTLSLDVSWVELPTGRAYSGRTTVPLEDVERVGDSIYFAPVFGPNGMLLLTSDPVPTSATDQPTRDLVQICGTRAPEADSDYRAAPDSLPHLSRTLAEPRPAFGDTICPEPEE